MEGCHTYKAKIICYNSPISTRTNRENTSMANRRLFSKSILYSDKFSTLSPDAAKLYIYMILEADDDGFIGHTRQILKMAEVENTALDTLIDCGFVIRFRSGVCVITHWHIHNT